MKKKKKNVQKPKVQRGRILESDEHPDFADLSPTSAELDRLLAMLREVGQPNEPNFRIW
jgi:hypothetical protein